MITVPKIAALLLCSVAFAAPAIAHPAQSKSASTLPRLMRIPLPGLLDSRLPAARPAPVARAKEQPQSYTFLDDPEAGTAAGQGTLTFALNATGASTGWYVDSSDDLHGFSRASDGAFTNFDADGLLSQTQPDWMNNHGTIVGFYFNANTGVTDGFVRTAGGNIETFDALGGSSSYTLCNSVNNRAVVVGNYGDSVADHGFLRAKDGSLTRFDAPGAAGTLGFDINDIGTVVGPYYDAGVAYHGYDRAADGTYTEFDVPNAGTGEAQRL